MIFLKFDLPQAGNIWKFFTNANTKLRSEIDDLSKSFKNRNSRFTKFCWDIFAKKLMNKRNQIKTRPST